MNKSLITYDSIKSIMSRKTYKFYTAPYDLNLVGIRTKDNTPNVFNDFFCIVYKDDRGQSQIFVHSCTTDPGLYWLKNPMNVKGTAILKEGQYLSCWKIGKHKGLYKALVQVGNMTVYRDNNRDAFLNLIPGTEDAGNDFGINYHHASGSGVSVLVDKWSAGCQVANVYKKYLESLELVDRQVTAGHGDKFSYTLLNEADFMVA